MDLVLKMILLLLGVVGFIVLVLWGYSRYWFATKQSDREIASGLSFGSDWVQILPKPPLRIQKHVQRLILIIDGDIQRSANFPGQFALPDGTLIDPELEIADEMGNTQRLESSICNSNICCGVQLPKDRVVTRVRIRSQNPFRCSRVIWECERLK